MPTDLQFDSGSSGLPQWYSSEDGTTIKAGEEVRIKIIGIRFANQQIVVVGSIKDDYLG